jgi:hypothetical protein
VDEINLDMGRIRRLIIWVNDNQDYTVIMRTGDLLQKKLKINQLTYSFGKKYFFVIMSEEKEKKQLVCKRGRCRERE